MQNNTSSKNMGNYTDKIVSYWSKHFSFPDLGTILLSYFTLLTIIFAILNIFYSTLLKYFLIIPLIHMYNILYIKLILGRAYTFRRAMGVNTILISYLFFPLLVASILKIKLETILSILAFLSVYQYSIMYLISRAIGWGLLKTIILTAPLLTQPILLSFDDFRINTFILLQVFILIILMVLIDEIFIFSFNKLGSNLWNIKSSEIVIGYVKLFLENNPTRLEAILSEKMSVKKTIHLFSLLFVDSIKKIPKLSLMALGAHPGPFRNLGGSILYEILPNFFTDIPIFPLHRASTHELDPVSSREIIEIVKDFHNALRLRKGVKVKVSSPFRTQGKHVSIFALPLSKHILAIVSSNNAGMDDISYHLEELVNSYLDSDKRIILIDAHNRLDESGYMIDESLIKDDVIKTLKKVNIQLDCKYDEIYIGFSIIRPEKYSIFDGLGPLGVMSIVLEFPNNERYFLIIYDGNNMINPLRDYIRNYIIDKYHFQDGEVLTTDNHLVTGLKSKVKYFPLGIKVKFNDLLQYAEKGILEAQRNITRCNILVFEKRYNIRVIGLDNLRKIEYFISKNMRMLKYILSMLFLVPLVHSLFFYIFFG